MNQQAVSNSILGNDAENSSGFRQGTVPPPLPSECDLPADRSMYTCTPPIVPQAEHDESPLCRLRAAATGSSSWLHLRAWRSRTNMRSTSWFTSIALHLFAILLLVFILAPADFGGTGTHRLSITLNQLEQQDQDTSLELALSDHLLSPEDSPSSHQNPLLNELTFQGISGITDRASALGRSATARGSFFGIEASGHEFVYVLDMSSSMRGRRFDRASAELMRSIEQLGPNQCFYVLLFSNETVQMFGRSNYLPKPLNATMENKERLAAWLLTAYRGGSTDPRQALQVAMRMNPSAIFMLSDGEFNGHKNQKRDQLLGGNSDTFSIVAASPTKPPIHAIALEDLQSRENMNRLAEMTEGEFRFVEQNDGTNPEVSIREASTAMWQCDLATAELFLREAVANLQDADGDDETEVKIQLGRVLLELAEVGLEEGELATVRNALVETLRLDPRAAFIDELQTTLVKKLLDRLQGNSVQYDASEIDSLLSECLERFPNSGAAMRIRDTLGGMYLNEARKLYANGESLQSIRRLETVIATHSKSAAIPDCQAEWDRIAEELLSRGEQMRRQQGAAASIRYLRHLVADFQGTHFQREVIQALEELAMELLVAERDAGSEHNWMKRKRIQKQLDEGFGKDPLLNSVRRELAHQERRAQAMFRGAIRLEKASQNETALGRYQVLVRDFSGTVAAQKAQDRIRVLDRVA